MVVSENATTGQGLKKKSTYQRTRTGIKKLLKMETSVNIDKSMKSKGTLKEKE